ncbi:MAG: helix-turn-helix transcriptional regulator [Sphaerobacter sp.]|nr:helix-turn-helix transcriptional regulator [Sphaerobacter sp.]
MPHRDYVAERERRDPAFRAARERNRRAAELAEAIIGVRLAAGLTQAELAELLGTTQSAVARWENGTVLPSMATVLKLLDVLDVGFQATRRTVAFVPPQEIEARAPQVCPLPR